MTQQLTLVGTPQAPPGVVYFATDLVRVKIGTTQAPRRRGGELKVHMLVTVMGDELEERRQHRIWRMSRIGKTEWFNPSDELIIWLAGHVSPSQPAAVAALQLLIFNTKRKAA